MIPFANFFRVFVIVAIVISMVSPGVFAASFSDVGSKYEQAVDFLVSKGIKGKEDGRFGTHEHIKRVDAAIFVVKALGLDIESAASSGFTDVPERAEKEVNALKAAGITEGKTETTFASQDLITRGELAIWIQRGFGLEVGKSELVFDDVGDRYQEAVSALLAADITNGTAKTTFGTTANAKRGDFAIFVYKASQVNNEKNMPAFKRITAINDRQLEITFDKAFDVEQASYIEKSGNQIAVFDKGASAKTANFVSEMISFSEDRKTAIVILKPTDQAQLDQGLDEGKNYRVALMSSYQTDLIFAEVEVESDWLVLLKGMETPEVKVDKEQNELIVKFDQRMDEEAKKPENYEVYDLHSVKANGALGNGKWVDATVKTAVRFDINPGVLSAGKTYKIRVNPNLESDNGSKVPASQLLTTFMTPSIAEAQPKVKLARVTGMDEITVTFDRNLSDSIPVNVYLITIGRSNGTNIDVKEVSFHGKNLVLKANEEDAFAEGFTYTVALPSGIAVNRQFLNAVNEDVHNIKAVGVENQAATEVRAKWIRQTSQKEKADLLLTFDQPVMIGNVKAGDLKVEGFGKTFHIAQGTPVEVYGEDPTGKTLVVKDVVSAFAMDLSSEEAKALTKFIPESGASYQVIVGEHVAKSISPVAEKDQKSNQAPLATIVDGIDVEAPKIEKVILHSAEKITVHFDERIIASGLEVSDLKVGGFIRSAGSRYVKATLTGPSTLGFSVSGDTLTITPANDSIKFQTGVIEKDATILSIGADTLKDENGIVNEGLEYLVRVNDKNLYDHAAPIMIGAKLVDVPSGRLEVTYSEAVYAKGSSAADTAKQFNVSGTERNQYGTYTNVAVNAEDADYIFEVTFTEKTFKAKDYSSAKLIYTNNSNYAIQDTQRNQQTTSLIKGIL